MNPKEQLAKGITDALFNLQTALKLAEIDAISLHVDDLPNLQKAIAPILPAGFKLQPVAEVPELRLFGITMRQEKKAE